MQVCMHLPGIYCAFCNSSGGISSPSWKPIDIAPPPIFTSTGTPYFYTCVKCQAKILKPVMINSFPVCKPCTFNEDV